MRDFCKYLAWGILALGLSLAWPQARVDALAIVLAQAFLGSERKAQAWLLLVVLACLTSAFSLASPATVAIPWALAALVFFALRRNFSFSPGLARFVLLFGLWLAPFLFWSARTALAGGGWYPEWGDALGLAATLAVGMIAPPLLSAAWARLWRRLRRLGGATGRVDLSRADWLSGRGARILRKPFGLEKGL
ncbi:hypothetical protein FBR05_15170 [Deltaproteobacteria bacterium PRO3]|nr:hypothetical protein [Deltaproteobacteria bacterium PRO3]